jgi:hypothetical protein
VGLRVADRQQRSDHLEVAVVTSETLLAFFSILAICAALTVEACNAHAAELKGMWDESEQSE